MSQSPLPDLDESMVEQSFDRGTLSRAQSYVGTRVDDIRVVGGADEGEVVLAATVQGSAARAYEVELCAVRSPGHWELFSDCTCPVGVGCKHGAALALTISRQQPTTPGTTSTPEPAVDEGPAWTERLGRVLDELDAGPADGRTQALALEVSIDRPELQESGSRRAPSWQVRASRPSLRMRPLGAGARGKWVKRGVGWDDLTRVSYSRTHDPDQLAPLLELSGARRSPYYYGGGDSPLDDFGPGLWAMLERARAAGVQLVGGTGLRSVVLVERPLSLTAELRSDEPYAADDDDPDTASAASRASRLVVGVWHDDRFYSGDDLLVVGQRGHGVGLLDADAGTLVLAPLDRLVPEPVRRLVDNPDPVRIPVDQSAVFLDTHLPRLRRHLPVASTDGSVPVPEEQPPALVLAIAWKGPGAAKVRWGWAYRSGDREVRTPLDAGASSGAVARRHDRERAHLARLDLGPVGDELLRGEDGGLLETQLLRGDRLLTLVGEVLPALRDDPLVEVEDVGVQPDHRPAESEPEIRFELAEDDGEGRVDWLNLRVVIDVDGEEVPLSTLVEAITEALRHDEAMVFLPSGRHLPTEHPALTRLADAVRAAEEIAGRKERDTLSIGTGDLGLWGELAEIGVVDEQARQWVEAAEALRGLTTLPQVDPPGMTSTLREYQLEGFRWLAFLHDAGLGGILADDMGLGKTLQTIALISHARAQGAGPFLVVAPTSVVPGWVREAATHAPGLDVRAVTAGRRRRGQELKDVIEGADVVVTTYTLLRLESDDYSAIPWGGLVLDEAQQVKNHQGKTYQAVRLIDAPFRLALTGTPFENRLMELWSLLSIVAPGLYPHPRTFAELVAKPVEKQHDEAALRRFRTRIRPFLLRRTKELVAADLPPKQEQVLDVALGAKHRKVYDAHLQRERQHILGLIEEDFAANRVAIFSSLTKLRQLSLDPLLVDPELDAVGSAKIDLLAEHLRELAEEGHRALVFSQFTGFLGRVRERLDAEGLTYAYLDGRTRDRDAAIEEFRGGDASAFLISLKAGGVGLTLTEATYVFVLDPWWNPATEAQAVDRAHRIGQHSPVTVYRLVATDTIEEKVMELKARKAALFAQVVDGDGAMSGAVTADDVRALLDS